MTVKELIKHLKTFPQNALVVYTEAPFGDNKDVEESDIHIKKSYTNDVNEYLTIGRIGCDCNLE